jgi:predicted GH43/DUF377 family glycosyl hydrolase
MNESGDRLRELFTRHLGNPILRATDRPCRANTVFNPGAVRLEDRRGVSHLSVARSRDGLSGWEIDAGR